MILQLRVLRLRQPRDRIGTHRVGGDLPAFTSIEAFQTEIESAEATEEPAQFLPGIFAPVDDYHGRAFTFIDPSVYRSALRVEAILTGPRAWKIGGAQIPHRQTSFNFPDQPGVRLSNGRFGWLENGKLIATRTAV